MLVLGRMTGETVVIILPDGQRITVGVCDIQAGRGRWVAKLGFDAPQGVRIYRTELLRRIEAAERAASEPAEAPVGLFQRMRALCSTK